MAAVDTAFRTNFRAYNVDGVPASGAHKTRKDETRALGGVIEGFVNGQVNTALGPMSAYAAAAAASAAAAAGSQAQASNQLNAVLKTVVTFTATGSNTTFPLGLSGVDARNVEVFIADKYQRHSLWSIVGTDLVFASAPAAGAGEIIIGGMTALVEPIAIGDLGDELAGLVSGYRRTIHLLDPQWGVAADGFTSDTAAIQAAIDSVPDNLYFPVAIDFDGGVFFLDAGLTLTNKNLALMGNGATIFYSVASGYVIDVDVASTPLKTFRARGLEFFDFTGNPATTALRVTGAVHCLLSDLMVTGSGGALDIGAGCVMTMLTQSKFEMQGGMPCITWRAGGGCITNVYARKGSTAGTNGPCFLLKGTTITSLQVSASEFGGKGTTRSKAITGITSNSSAFTVTATAHSYLAGETIVIRNAADADYDGCWQIESVGANTVTILDTRNIGTAGAGGVVEKLHATVVFDNSDGPINETSWAAVLFEGIDDGGSAGMVGSVSVLMDAGGNSTLAAHEFAACLFDCGQTGLHLFGKSLPGDDRTIQGIHVTGGRMRFLRAGIYMRQVASVFINGVQQNCLRDHSAVEAVYSAALVIDGYGAQPCRGVFVNGNCLGRQEDMRSDVAADRCASFGLVIYGPDHQELHFHDNHIYGLTAATYSELAATARVRASGNVCHSGAGGEEASVETILASASSIDVPFLVEQIFLSGSTTVQTINGGHVYREIVLGSLAGLTLGTSGNIAAGKTLTAGQTARLTWSDSLSKFMVN